MEKMNIKVSKVMLHGCDAKGRFLV